MCAPASLTFQEGAPCPAAPSPGAALPISSQKGKQFRKGDAVGQKEGSLSWSGGCLLTPWEELSPMEKGF